MFSRYSYFKTPIKVSISPGQALLILIQKYQSTIDLKNELKSLYLSGADSPITAKRIKQLFIDECLENYQISFDSIIISEDPTRRFFETNLSYFTLSSSLKNVDDYKLEKTLKYIFSRLTAQQKTVVNTNFQSKNINSNCSTTAEFHDAFLKIKHHKCFEIFSKNDKIKMISLNQFAYLSLYLAQNETLALPLNIFKKGYYKTKHRSRITKSEQEQKEVRSCGLGLMKSYMPLPRSNLVFDENISKHTRVADRNSFDPESKWARDNFSRLVHPFSASISGTILAFIRVLADLYDCQQLKYTQTRELKTLFKCYISLLLFNSGGHSLHEFVAPINLPEIQDYFKSIRGFSELNLKSMFLTGNEEVFDLALNEALVYNCLILNKKKVNATIAELSNIPRKFLPLKLEVLDNLYRIKELLEHKTLYIFILHDLSKEAVSLISSCIINLSEKSCSDPSIIAKIIQKLHFEMLKKINFEIKALMEIFVLTDLFSHKTLNREYNYFCEIINNLELISEQFSDEISSENIKYT
ncbi:MAG: hypothetical protein H0U70_05905 [Tatlockia sp.]|nr:hypothetical protein [Tatlockia sp.]